MPCRTPCRPALLVFAPQRRRISCSAPRMQDRTSRARSQQGLTPQPCTPSRPVRRGPGTQSRSMTVAGRGHRAHRRRSVLEWCFRPSPLEARRMGYLCPPANAAWLQPFDFGGCCVRALRRAPCSDSCGHGCGPHSSARAACRWLTWEPAGRMGSHKRRSLTVQHRNQRLILGVRHVCGFCLAFTCSGRFQSGNRIGAILLVSVPCGRGRSGRDCWAAPGGLDAVGIGFPLPDVVEVGLIVQRARDRLGYAWPVSSLLGIQDRRQFLDEGVRGVRRFVVRPATRGSALGPEPILKLGGRADAELAQDIAVGRLLLTAVLVRFPAVRARLVAHVEEQDRLVDPIDQSIDVAGGFSPSDFGSSAGPPYSASNFCR
jgi:hypothetical protein